MERHLPPEGETVVLTFLPLNHIYARTCDLYFCLCSGRILALVRSLNLCRTVEVYRGSWAAPSFPSPTSVAPLRRGETGPGTFSS